MVCLLACLSAYNQDFVKPKKPTDFHETWCQGVSWAVEQTQGRLHEIIFTFAYIVRYGIWAGWNSALNNAIQVQIQ